MSLRETLLSRVEALRAENDAARRVLTKNEPILAELVAILAAGDEEPVTERNGLAVGRRVETIAPLNGSKHDVILDKPATAVRKYLANKPDGVALKMVVDDLQERIESTSPDKKRILYNTIFNLRKRGTLVATQDEQGREGVRLANQDITEEE